MKIFLTLLFVCLHTYAHNTLYVANSGSDSFDGTKSKPFGTLKHACKHIKPSGTIYLREGTYPLGIYIKVSGSQDAPITIKPYQNEKVVFEGDKSLSNNDFRVLGSWLVIENFEIKDSANGLLLEKGASHNIIRNIRSHHNHFSGFMVTRGAAYNSIINCDAHHNFDKGGSLGDGGHADGFGTGSRIGDNQYIGPGNQFINCRSWKNSDDGFDLWKSGNPVTIIGCMAFENGYAKGDGNGFKLGPHNPIQPLDNHIVIDSIAWNNRQNGFDFNENSISLLLYNNLAYNNNVNYKFLQNGIHKLIDNISLNSQGKDKISAYVFQSNNQWIKKDKIVFYERLLKENRDSLGNLKYYDFPTLYE